MKDFINYRPIAILKKILFFIFLCLLCQHIIGAVFVLGWTFRRMRRRSILLFSSVSKIKEQEVLLDISPNLFRKENSDVFGEQNTKSIFSNFKIGFLAFLHSSLILAPGFVLWMYAWYAGWQISFNKSYEYSNVGVSLGFLGIFLFSLVMLYLPMAQARYAFTQQWQTFYHFKVNFKLISQQVKSILLLALLFLFFAVFTNAFKTLPMFIHGLHSGIYNMSDEELLSFLKTYFLVGTIIVMPLYFITKKYLAKLYAKALILCVQKKLLSQNDITEFEWEQLNKFGLTEVDSVATTGLIWSLIKRNTSRLIKVQMLILTFIIWVAFCLQIFVSEFLNYHNQKGWVNQPLVQLPYFSYIPKHLNEPEKEDFIITNPEEMSEDHPILK